MFLQGAIQLGQDSAVTVVLRQPGPGRSVTWTGPGLARVPSGAGLRFVINNIPFAMDFDIIIRYEPQVLVISCVSWYIVIDAGSVLSVIGCRTLSLSVFKMKTVCLFILINEITCLPLTPLTFSTLA